MSQEQFEQFTIDNAIISMEKAIEFVGNNSKYQKKIFYIFAIQYILYSFLIMGMPFFYLEPLFTCVDSQDPSFTYVCSNFYGCKDRSLNTENDIIKSIATEFDLICEQKQYIGYVEACLFLGMCIGYLIVEELVQKFGYKQLIIKSTLISSLSICLCAAMPAYQYLGAIYIVVGISFTCYEQATKAYFQEISSKRFINFSTISFVLVWMMAQIIFNPLSKMIYIIGWRYTYVFIIALPLCLSQYLIKKYLFESPKYLVKSNDFQQARSILNQIASINKRPQFTYTLEGELDDPYHRRKSNAKKISEDKHVEQQSQIYSFIDLFKYKSVRNQTIYLFILWLYCDMTSWGVVYSLSSYGQEFHENWLLISMSGFLATIMIIQGPIKNKLPLKKALIYFQFIAVLASLLPYFIDIPNYCYDTRISCYQERFTVVLAMVYQQFYQIFNKILKFSTTIIGFLLQSYTENAFPKVIQKRGQGVAYMGGKIGTLIMPLIIVEFQLRGYNPLVAFGLIGILALVMTFDIQEDDYNQDKNYIQETLFQDKALLK